MELISALLLLSSVTAWSSACTCVIKHPQDQFCEASFGSRNVEKCSNNATDTSNAKDIFERFFQITVEWVTLTSNSIIYNSKVDNVLRMAKDVPKPEKTVDLVSGRNTAECGVDFDVNIQYLVTGNYDQESKEYRVSLCNFSKEYTKLSPYQRTGVEGDYDCTCKVTSFPPDSSSEHRFSRKKRSLRRGLRKRKFGRVRWGRRGRRGRGWRRRYHSSSNSESHVGSGSFSGSGSRSWGGSSGSSSESRETRWNGYDHYDSYGDDYVDHDSYYPETSRRFTYRNVMYARKGNSRSKWRTMAGGVGRVRGKPMMWVNRGGHRDFVRVKNLQAKYIYGKYKNKGGQPMFHYLNDLEDDDAKHENDVDGEGNGNKGGQLEKPEKQEPNKRTPNECRGNDKPNTPWYCLAKVGKCSRQHGVCAWDVDIVTPCS